ncbi:MAG: serine/threonine-protein kinase [Myxococcales bacterium]
MSFSTIPAPGQLGPYELIRRLATGGMAEVYLARRGGPHGFQKIVALKRILPQFTSDQDFVAMFIDEARVCARLGHPNIVQVFDFGEQNGELYMAMEFVNGTTGARLIRNAAIRGEEIPVDVILHIGLSILHGLEYAHSARDDDGQPLALVHRDVSPGNVLIDRSGAVKLTDFGIARAAAIERRTDAGQLKGKLGYMSPEQVVGRELDSRSDLFTVGIVLSEMAMLRPLFNGGQELDVLLRIRDADLSALDRAAHRVPDDLRNVLIRALARDPAVRYQTATVFAEALEEVARRRRIQVGPSRLAAWIERSALVEGSFTPAEDEALTGPTTANLELPLLDPTETIPGALHVAPKIYRVTLESGRAIGPISYPGLIELFATGVAGSSTQVAREQGSFKPAGEYAELSRFITSPALCWDLGIPLDAIDRGFVDRAKLPTRIFQLAFRHETGALMLSDGLRRKKVFFVSGVPELVASTDKHELLGEFLIARGQVLRMEVEMALAMLPRFGEKLGDALVGLGVLRPIELFRAIHDQTEERFVEMFAWHSGEIGFCRGARSHEETFPLGIDPYALIAKGICKHYPPEELHATLAPLSEEVLIAVASPPVRAEMFRLPDREAAVLDSIVARTTLIKLMAEMVASGTADPEEVMRAVFLGLCCELLQCPRWVIPFSTVPRSRPSERA